MRAIVALTFVLACAWASAQTNYLPTIKWRTVGEGQTSKIKKAENRFIHTSGDLQNWWMLHSGQSAATVPHKFDPNKEFLVAIHSGEKSTGGYKVYVETVARTTAASAVIAVVESQPRKGSMNSQALTQPWVLVAIERPGVQNWQFKSRTITVGAPRGPAGCSCCEPCKKSCADVKIYNPAPLGIFSTDNDYGIRPLGLVPFTDYAYGDESAIERSGSFIVQSERQFEEYWSMHRPDSRVRDSGVNWNKEQLVALHIGRVPTNGYRMRIIGIDRTWFGTLNLIYGLETPKFGDRVRRESTSPYAIVRMSRITEPINFVRRDDLLKNRCECSCRNCGCLH